MRSDTSPSDEKITPETPMPPQQFHEPARPFTSSLADLAALPPSPSRRRPDAAAPAPAPAAQPTGPALRAIRGDELPYAATEWVWPGRVAGGKLTLIGGAPGTGKSTLMMRIAATVTSGGAWPCGEGAGPQGEVLVGSEGGDADTNDVVS